VTLRLDYAAKSDVGMVRKGNEDSGYAGPHLLVIADGMGGHAFGEVASSAAIGVLAELEPAAGEDAGGPEGAEALVRENVAKAGRLLRSMIRDRPELEGMGTTVTALRLVGGRVVIAQVGDSRGYLLRDGVLEQVTHDQTFVQSLIDEGRISHEAARTHPQRSLLLQALDGRAEVEPELTVRDPLLGDRYLLCSDGLSGVLSEATMRDVLMVGSPTEAVDQLVDLALRSGAPDNVTCLVADVIDDGGDPAAEATDDAVDNKKPEPTFVGAAAEAHATAGAPGDSTGPDSTGPDQAAPSGEDDEGGAGGHHRGRGIRLLLPIVLLLLVVAAAAFFGYRWTQQQYYVGAAAGQVVIYQGVPQHVGGHHLSKVVETSDVAVADLPTSYRDQVESTIPADSLAEARTIVGRLEDQAQACLEVPTPEGCATAATTSSSPTPSASAS
jgi:PPM family protein phosphatase